MIWVNKSYQSPHNYKLFCYCNPIIPGEVCQMLVVDVFNIHDFDYAGSLRSASKNFKYQHYFTI